MVSLWPFKECRTCVSAVHRTFGHCEINIFRLVANTCHIVNTKRNGNGTMGTMTTGSKREHMCSSWRSSNSSSNRSSGLLSISVTFQHYQYVFVICGVVWWALGDTAVVFNHGCSSTRKSENTNRSHSIQPATQWKHWTQQLSTDARGKKTKLTSTTTWGQMSSSSSRLHWFSFAGMEEGGMWMVNVFLWV